VCFLRQHPIFRHLIHRQDGYNLLTGHGLEIGAFHQPTTIPAHCTIEYCDADSKEELIRYFPELSINALVDVNYICDLDKQGLSLFENERFNFVILNCITVTYKRTTINTISRIIPFSNNQRF
jgi:hypothetical protein